MFRIHVRSMWSLLRRTLGGFGLVHYLRSRFGAGTGAARGAGGDEIVV